jgi:hypothetical protein
VVSCANCSGLAAVAGANKHHFNFYFVINEQCWPGLPPSRKERTSCGPPRVNNALSLSLSLSLFLSFSLSLCQAARAMTSRLSYSAVSAHAVKVESERKMPHERRRRLRRAAKPQVELFTSDLASGRKKENNPALEGDCST